MTLHATTRTKSAARSVGGDARELTNSGTLKDVAAFFCVSARTVHQWVTDGKLGCWQEAQRLVFGEESVVTFRAAYTRHADALKPGEAVKRARSEWHSHLELRRADDLVKRLEAAEKRIEELEHNSSFPVEIHRGDAA